MTSKNLKAVYSVFIFYNIEGAITSMTADETIETLQERRAPFRSLQEPWADTNCLMSS